ncbi:CYTH domain-containing protein [Streptococcus cuniculipharyngis]|uniref:CYTH domain-containing protein n=1 Tax=Streptococcus cuniculipharyngis TaxID=1562651 RepID=A0A5C5SF49_9STRE|nr:CYTH domain-containing protein [Streptococcus cuniculipharyngis]TWS98920.1 CYTH domain-containing protein [Streptococcus cuniculipharyngis]
MTHLEIEYKTLLTKDEYKRLDLLFSHVPAKSQTNYYFDTDNFLLKQHRLSLRIRTLADRAELTLKIPQTTGNLEYNHPLDLTQAKQMIHSGAIPLNSTTQLIVDAGIPLTDLGLLGHLTTVRRETQLPIGLLALDRNYYGQVKDYELELEVLDAKTGQKDFLDFLAQYHIDYKFAKSKVARFSSTLKKK